MTGIDRPIFLFDLGGTLMEGPEMSPSSRFITELNLPWEVKETINSFLFSEDILDPGNLADRFSSMFTELGPCHREKIHRIWHSQFSEGYALSGAFTLLRKIRDAGYRMGIISNIWHPFFSCFSSLFSEFLSSFDVITLSYRVGLEKPDPSVFRHTMDSFAKKFGVSCEVLPSRQFCMVGDSYYHDIAPAIESDMKTIWILQKVSREIPYLEGVQNCTYRHPDLIVSNLEHLSAGGFSLLREIAEG